MIVEVAKVKQIGCYTEYEKLKRVILCSPEYMKIDEVINATQRKYAVSNINAELAVKQHKQLVHVLEKYDIEVLTLPPSTHLPEQVFTRDVGFTIGNHLFIAQLKSNIRKDEEKILLSYLEQQHIAYHKWTHCHIEGGDVMIDGNRIWIGHSDRTSHQAIAMLQTLLPQFHIQSISFPSKYLHLDCVFNIVSSKEALIYPPALEPSDIERLSKHYELIEVSTEEQFTLAVNVLSIGNKTLFALPINRKTNEQLRHRGYHVVEIDISEIIKSGGAFRCVTLPLVREP